MIIIQEAIVCVYVYLYKQSVILALKRNRLSAQILSSLFFVCFILCSSTQSNNVTNNNHPLRKYRTIFNCFASAQDIQNCAREKLLSERENIGIMWREASPKQQKENIKKHYIVEI